MMRVVHLNPVGPAALSMRSPMGFDLLLDLIYRDFNAVPVNVDLAATLVLEGRTTGRSNTYLAAGIDIVNGKARVRVPGGDLTDPNGYRATLVGTVGGARQVIGAGVLQLTGDGAQETISTDVIDTVPLTFGYGQDAVINVALWQDVAGSAPFDLTAEGVTVKASVYASQGGALLAPFTVDVLASNRVSLTLPAATVNTLPASGWWVLYAANATGTTALCQGSVTILEP